MAGTVISPRVGLIAGGAGAIAIIGAALVVLKPGAAPTGSGDRPIKLVELIGAKYPMGQTVDALEAPSRTAPSVTRVRQGSEVEVVGIVEGDGWYQISLPDKQLAYVQVGAIPAAATPAAAAPAATTAPAAAPAPAVPAPAAQAVAAPPSPAPAAAAPAVAASVNAPAPAAATPPPADAAMPPPTVDVPPVVEFGEAHDIARVVSPTAVYLKPDMQAPQAYPVGVGTEVYVIARSKDGNWAWVNTADNAEAYIPQANLGP
jgi:hypothetical protein